MKVRLWGTRGSLAAPGADTVRYGGNTACVEVRARADSVVVLDAGTGIRRLGTALPPGIRRVDILLSHLHLDHVQGLGFFRPLYRDDLEVHLWGPSSHTAGLRTRLARYLSHPLFPVRLADLPARPSLHDVPLAEGGFEVPGLTVAAALVCHPGTTLGYRLTDGEATLAYLPDHEPALGPGRLPDRPEWTSGFDLAHRADLLLHDAQYSSDEYRRRVGWGHSSVEHAVAFAAAAEVGQLVPFHHDPAHDDDGLDRLLAEARRHGPARLRISPGVEGAAFEVTPAA